MLVDLPRWSDLTRISVNRAVKSRPARFTSHEKCRIVRATKITYFDMCTWACAVCKYLKNSSRHPIPLFVVGFPAAIQGNQNRAVLPKRETVSKNFAISFLEELLERCNVLLARRTDRAIPILAIRFAYVDIILISRNKYVLTWYIIYLSIYRLCNFLARIESHAFGLFAACACSLYLFFFYLTFDFSVFFFLWWVFTVSREGPSSGLNIRVLRATSTSRVRTVPSLYISRRI